jgi:hypothetical protein
MLDWIYNTQPWISSSILVACGIAAVCLVQFAIDRCVSTEIRHAHNEFTRFTVTNMSVLYAVLLAFITIAAWEALSKATDITVAEASHVEALYLDAEGLDDRNVAEAMRAALRRYLHAVVEQEWPVQQAGGISDAAAPSLRQVRKTLASFKPATPGDTMVMQEMFRYLNELNNIRRARLEAAAGHIPESVWSVIIVLGIVTIGFTTLAGMRSGRVHVRPLAGFTATIVMVVALIVQLDYPFRGEISVSVQPFKKILAEFEGGFGSGAPAAR